MLLEVLKAATAERGFVSEEEIWEMSHVPPDSEELSNPSSGHTSHGTKSWSYQYSRLGCRLALEVSVRS